MFKVGDIVEITEESDATGMLDFERGKGYEVIHTANEGHSVFIRDEGGCTCWYYYAHFKLKEDTIVEKKECLFKEGQVVWDVRYVEAGKVCDVYESSLEVQYSFGVVGYSLDGKPLSSVNAIRTLFFSEPKIEAAIEPLCGTESLFTQGDSVLCRVFGQGTVLSISEEDDEVHVEFKNGGTRNYTLGGKLYDLFPDEVVTLSIVKQAFTPTLKEGEVVVLVCKAYGKMYIVKVFEETEDRVESSEGTRFAKCAYDYYRLGEKINFK